MRKNPLTGRKEIRKRIFFVSPFLRFYYGIKYTVDKKIRKRI